MPRGSPLEPQVIRSIFTLLNSTRTPAPDPDFIRKGAAAPFFGGCCIYSAPHPLQPRGPRAPLLDGRFFQENT